MLPAGNQAVTPPPWRHWLLLIGLAISIVLWTVLPTHLASSTSLTYARFTSDVAAREVKTANIPPGGGTSTGTLTDGTRYNVNIPASARPSVLSALRSANVSVSTSASPAGSQALSWLVLLAPLAVFGWLWVRLSRRGARPLREAHGILPPGQGPA
ncbi:MAG TPA: ATP-dependent metallopeptidase FtsH/Yme1/Tma family protein [Trebonia sp.]|nr:ATP-dependent metallopeptidase FtsH/Yme1/Tma family protein [Trebonia sp.]